MAEDQSAVSAEAYPSVAAMLRADSASRALGIEVFDLGDGFATAQMRVRADMVNGHGIAHGGFVFSVADTAFACACNSFGPAAVAASADISFITPAQMGDLLTARAEERTRFGRSAIYDVTVRCEERVVAEFRGRSRQVDLAGPA